jgi:cation:H+ antiporter
MDVSTALLFTAGLGTLVLGAELLVRGASRLAAAVGISPLVIGLTVVTFGTSTPELAVSVRGALSSQADIALGNVVGSNIFNVLFILGLSALITPLVVSQQLVRLDVPIMIGVSVLLVVLALDGRLARLDGIPCSPASSPTRYSPSARAGGRARGSSPNTPKSTVGPLRAEPEGFSLRSHAS